MQKMERIIQILLVFSFSFFFVGAKCPPGTYGDDKNNCFLFEQYLITCSNAYDICTDIGWQMVSIHNAFQNAFIQSNSGFFEPNNFLGLLKNLTQTEYVWLGAYDVDCDNFNNYLWMWWDNTPFDYYNFAPGRKN